MDKSKHKQITHTHVGKWYEWHNCTDTLHTHTHTHRCISTHTDEYIQSCCPSLCSNVWPRFCFLIKALVFSPIRRPIKWRVSTLLRFSSCAQHKWWKAREKWVQQHMEERDRWMALDTWEKGRGKETRGVENQTLIRNSEGAVRSHNVSRHSAQQIVQTQILCFHFETLNNQGTKLSAFMLGYLL